MNFFHISDLHIGKQLYGYSLAEDQAYVLRLILDALQREKPDALLVTGDIYDKPVPSGEAVQMFDGFLTEVTKICPQMPVMIIAGNHDAAKRIDYAGEILCRHNIYIVGTPPKSPEDNIRRVTISDEYGEVDFYLLPFFKPANLRGVFSEEENDNYVNQAREKGISEYEVYFEALLAREEIDKAKRNVLLMHQFFMPGDGKEPERTESEVVTVGMIDHISSHLLHDFDYVAMGHLHRPQKCQKETYRYCGTPMPYSLSEEKDEKSITVVTIEELGKEAEISTIPLIPLRKVRKLKGTIKELYAVAMEEGDKDTSIIDDYVSLVVTDDEPGRYVREQLGVFFSHILEIRFDNRYMNSLMEDMPQEGLSNDYFEMFRQFYEMRNGEAMNEEEAQIFGQLLYDTKEEDV